MQLTDEQKQALDFSRNISVTAGAGAGKTRLLVERFMEIATRHYRQKPYQARKILAITFTNKAAGEMRERIAQAVNERLQEAKDKKERQHLLGIRDQLNSVAISTIHSFCARILREYPIEAQLPPDFGELDDMQSSLLMSQAIDQLFEEINATTDDQQRNAYLELFQYFEPKKIRLLLRRALSQPYEMSAIVERFVTFNDEQDYFAFVSQLWLEAINQLWPASELQKLFSLAGSLVGKLKPAASEAALKADGFLQQLSVLYGKASLSVEEFRIVFKALEFYTAQKGKAYSSLRSLGGKKSWQADAEPMLLALSEQSAQLLSLLKTFDPGPPPGDNDRLYFRLFTVIFQLYQRARQFYEDLKAEIPGLDFEDLLIKVYQLLKDNPRVRQELARRYEFIMVDEFQDTNALQWKIIELLASEEGRLCKQKIFVVGDPKQSIYGFRNADIRIFKAVKQQLARVAGYNEAADYSGNVLLKNSFRFLPRINAFINDLFADLLQPSAQNIYEVEFEPLTAQRDVPEKGHIELAVLREEDQLTEEAYIAQTIERLVRNQELTCHERKGSEEKERKLEFGDIAILLRSRSELLQIEQALRNRDIPFKTVKGIGYWQRQEIQDFYHLLNFLADPESDFYLVALLRSKLFLVADRVLFHLSQEEGQTYWQKLGGELKGPYSEQERAELQRIANRLRRWIELRDLLPLGELLRLVLDELNYPALIMAQTDGEQLLANVEKFIEHVYRFNKSGLSGLLELIRQLELLIEENLKEGEPQINLDDRETVKIMTIHAAKGLQFPVVFIPYLNTKNVDNVRQAVFLEPEIGLATAFRSDTEESLDDFCLLKLLKLEKKKRELAEAKRIFYVAVTRASEHLFFSARIKDGKIQRHSFLEWLQAFSQKRQADLLDKETTIIEGQDYQLHVVHQLQAEEFEEQQALAYRKELESLKQQLDKTAPVEPEDLQPYQPLKDVPGPLIFSATRLMTFMEDKENYYHRYHLGFFESDYQLFAENIYRMDDSLVKGKIFHRFLELSTQKQMDEQELLERIFFEFEVFDDSKRQQLKKEIHELKDKMYASEQGRAILQTSQARNELTVTMRLGNDFFTGTIDRIIKNEEGLWQVVDYKTNRIQAAQVAETAQKYDWQMRGYALLLSQLFPQQKVFPVMLYFVHPARLYQIVYSRDEIAVIKREFENLIEKIKRTYPVAP